MVRFASGLAVARAWPGARFKRTFGLGHRRVLRDAGVIGAALDFMSGRVVFSPPPQADEWSEAFASLSEIRRYSERRGPHAKRRSSPSAIREFATAGD